MRIIKKIYPTKFYYIFSALQLILFLNFFNFWF